MLNHLELSTSDKLNLKVAQLNILQNLIARMANYILAIKILSIAIMLILLTLSKTTQITFYWGVFLIPCLGFALYHAYFLKLELAFRQLYHEATNQIDICISDFKIDKETLVRIPPNFIHVLCSKALLAFHILLLGFISLLYFS